MVENIKNINAQSFEEMLAELEKIVSQLENGEATLEEALEMYKKGTLLASKCGELLDNAEKQIKILVNGTNGEMTENDFAGNEI
ncbi:MAG: exodeoxyribonuclease VII small subunit [Clostridia bacterium]|nr:exodeoxyribonuclease VII small subunit [Clostridia bacterium]